MSDAQLEATEAQQALADALAVHPTIRSMADVERAVRDGEVSPIRAQQLRELAADAGVEDEEPEPDVPSHDSVWADLWDLPPSERQAYLDEHLAEKTVYEQSGGVVIDEQIPLDDIPIPSRDDEGYRHAADMARGTVPRLLKLVESGDIVADPDVLERIDELTESARVAGPRDFDDLLRAGVLAQHLLDEAVEAQREVREQDRQRRTSGPHVKPQGDEFAGRDEWDFTLEEIADLPPAARLRFAERFPARWAAARRGE
jgi:hypothetical protein